MMEWMVGEMKAASSDSIGRLAPQLEVRGGVGSLWAVLVALHCNLQQ